MSFKYSRALVTGGSGFIGSHIIENLLNKDVSVICLDKTDNLENLKQFSDNKKLKIINCDITNYEEIEKYFKDIDVVFHNAALKYLGKCTQNPRLCFKINVEGTFNILEASRNNNIKKFIFASACSAYGLAMEGVDETCFLNPVSHYGTSKAAGEKYSMLYHNEYGMNVSVLRYSNVYGPKESGSVITLFIKKIMENEPISVFGDGSQTRRFTYIKDVVNANTFACEKEEANGQIFNIIGDEKVSINQLIKIISKNLGKNPKINYEKEREGDVEERSPSSEKIKKLGFKFTPFEQGLKETIEWHKKTFI